ncbi:MAG: pyridoxal phosphate-dependent aminotransferase [Candidatus Omnitrophica bacterium]|nr:pyridoxal phosphate-dependent aminotransferase [Candidatus Omnitrophota bacterium]
MAYFSRRTNWDLGESVLSRTLEAMRAQGSPFFDLTESNPTRCGFSYPEERFLTPLSSKEILTYAPMSKGMPAAREALVQYYARKAVSLSLEEIVLTSSTSEAYSFLFRLLMEPGDKVLIPAPSYPLFSYLADINDVVVDHYFLRLEEGRWRINLESIEQALDKKTRAIVLVSPNNPTGSFIKQDELAALNCLCAAHNCALISDEVFADYIFPGQEKEFVSIAGNADVLSFALGGISKALALPQMKLSWIAANGPCKVLAEALERIEVIADTYLSVNTPVQHAAAMWLRHMGPIRDQVMARVVGNYELLRRMAHESGCAECLPVEGGWYAILHVPSLKGDESWAIRLLKEAGVYVHPGFFFDFQDEEHVIISLLPQHVIFESGVGQLLRFLKGT